MLLEKNPDSDFVAEAKLAIADSYFRLKDWSKAIEVYERVISEHTEAVDFFPYCFFQVGEAYYKLGTDQKNADRIIQATVSLESALQWYQKTITNYPQDSIALQALYSAVKTLDALGRKEELEDVAREFINKAQDSSGFDSLVAEVQLILEGLLRDKK